MRNRLFYPLLLAAALASGSQAQAATATGSFGVQVILQATCIVTSPTSTLLDFGTQTLLNANVDASTAIGVQCSSGTTYDVSLDNGLNASRRMKLGTNFVTYQLYKDAARTTVWPTAAVTPPYPYTGTGAAQSITVYGRIPIQTTPPASATAYVDTVGITVTY
jgi:spore coat protein U-like protein